MIRTINQMLASVQKYCKPLSTGV